MRSGRAYLSKRATSEAHNIFESRQLGQILPPVERAPETPAEDAPVVETVSELDRPQWSVVSFTGVEAGGLTYPQAARLIDVLGDNGVNGLSIITDTAASRIRD